METPSNTNDNTQKTKLKFYDNGETIEASKVYDGQATISFILDNKWLTIDGEGNINEDVKVRLSITAKQKDVSDNIENYNIFKAEIIEGSDKYEISDYNFRKQVKDSGRLKVKIAPLPLVVKVNNPQLYYGQTIDYEILEGNLRDEFKKNNEKNINLTDEQIDTIIEKAKALKPEFNEIVDGETITATVNDSNYIVFVKGNPTYKVIKYNPPASVKPSNFEYKNGKIMLTAPENYQIFDNNKSGFGRTAEFDFDEAKSELTYYLMNTKTGDKEYMAISEPRTYVYCNEKPSVGEISITVSENNYSDMPENKLLTNQNVQFVIPIKKYEGISADTTVSLYLNYKKKVLNETTQKITEEDVTEDVSKTIEAADLASSNGEYYDVTFNVNVDENVQKEIKFEVKAKNFFSESAVYNSFRVEKNSDNSYTVLILDKLPALVYFSEPTNNYSDFGVEISDANGIGKVEYNWDGMAYSPEENVWYEISTGEKSYIEYNGDVINGKEYTFSLTNAYIKSNAGNILMSKQQKKHKLYLKVTDKAGNVYENGDGFAQNNAPDNIQPEVHFVDFVKSSKNIVDKVTRTDFGNFYNSEFTLRIQAVDEAKENSSASGVESVELLIKDGNELKKYGNFTQSIDTNLENGFKIAFYPEKVNDNRVPTRFEDIKIRVTDNAENEKIYSLSELSSESCEIKSNDILIEDGLPTVSAEFVNGEYVQNLDNQKLYYYGNDKKDGIIRLSFSDNFYEDKNSGLRSVEITDTVAGIKRTKTIFSKEFKEALTTDFVFSQAINEQDENGDYEFEEGKHTLEVLVYDNCGNSNIINGNRFAYTFVVDRTDPEGVFDVQTITNDDNKQQPVYIEKDGKETLWFDKNTDIKVDVVLNDANLDRAEIQVDDGDVIELTKTDTIIINQGGNQHSHIITGIVYDKAGNSFEFEKLMLYRDFAVPEFDIVTVEKSNNDNALDKILNVLTFGIYSNANVKIKAKVHDGENDSGIDRVVIKLDQEEKETAFIPVGNGEYYYEFNKLNGEDYVDFHDSFRITVYDKFGKKTVCQKISMANAVVEIPQIPEDDKIPESSEVPEVSETTEVSETSEIPETSESFEISETSEISEVLEVSSISLDDKDDKFSIAIENGQPVISYLKSSKVTIDQDGKDVEWYNDKDVDDNKISIGVSDAESGIGNITVKDNGIEIYNKSFYDTIKDIPTEIKFPITDLSEGEHKFIVSVTDKSGNNTTKDEYVFYVDRTQPMITFGQILSGESDVADKVTRTTFGNFYNDDITLQLNVSDAETPAISGVKYVTMTADNLDDEIKIPEEGIVKFDLPLNASKVYQNIQFTVTDNAGNERKYELKNIFGRYGMRSNDFLLEKESPNIEQSRTGNVVFSGKDFFGNANKESQNIKFKFSDNHSGIEQIIITDTVKDKTETLVEEKFNQLEKTMEYDFNKSVKELADGEHIFDVLIIDNSGNKETITYTFVVDYTRPEGSLNVTPERTIDGKKWFDGKTVINVGVDVTEVNIKTVDIEVNGQKYQTFTEGDFRQPVFVKLDQNQIGVNKEQKYIVTGKITDKAGNEFIYPAVELYRDFESPIIDSVTVSNDGKSPLSVLPFGVYSNNAVTLTAKVSDNNNNRNYDSGIDYVKISYDGIEDTMRAGKNGVYTYSLSKIPSNGKVEITAYDKFGKFVENKNTNLMLENIKPTVSIDRPVDDDDGRSSDYWYNPNRANKNITKNITLKVRDYDSGIRNISVDVNGTKQTYDSKGNEFLIDLKTEKADKANTDEQIYYLNVDTLAANTDIPVSSDGKYTVNITVTDNAGNETTSSTIFYVDKTNPKVEKFKFSAVDGAKDINNWIDKLEYGFYFKQDFYITVDLSDAAASSGLQKIAYNLVRYKDGNKIGEDGFVDASLNQDKSSATFRVEKGFKGQIYVKVYDNVNNSPNAVSPQAFVIDTETVHGQETHIEMSHSSQTNKKDMLGNALYTNHETVKVVVTDTVSGIKNVSYSVKSENQNVALTDITFDNTGYNINDVIGGWRITKMDSNLVTELTREFVFDSDNNDIILNVGMTDNATNESNLPASTFTVDKTTPKVEVSFDNNNDHNGGYYQAKRTATITITERNFDSGRIDARVNGGSISLNFKSKDKVTHTANYEFGEGDYNSFTVNGTDCSDRELSYNSNRFWVDLKDPQISLDKDNEDEFKNSEFKNSNGVNLFNSEKTMKFIITEHNFDESLVVVNNNGQKISPKFTGNSGDTHTLEITFNKSGSYHVTVQVTDKSERKSKEYVASDFEIDIDPPKLDSHSPKDKAVLDYVDGTPVDSIIFTDKNIDKVKVTIESYTVKDHRVVYRDSKDEGNHFEVEDADNGKITVDLTEVITGDGVYEVTTDAYDKAGNNSGKKKCTFLVLRDSENKIMVGLSDSAEKYINKGGINSRSIDDMVINIYMKEDNKFSISMDADPLDQKYYDVSSKTDCVNGIKCYQVTLKKQYFADKYPEGNTQRTEMWLSMSEVDKNEKSINYLTIGKITIDNEDPQAEYPSELNNVPWYKYRGYYDNNNDNPYELVIKNVSPDINFEKSEFYDNNSQIDNEDANIIRYNDKENTIIVKLKEGYHDFHAVIYDTSENYDTMDDIYIYVGSVFGRWEIWVLVAFAIIVLGTVLCFIVRIIIKRRK